MGILLHRALPRRGFPYRSWCFLAAAHATRRGKEKCPGRSAYDDQPGLTEKFVKLNVAGVELVDTSSTP